MANPLRREAEQYSASMIDRSQVLATMLDFVAEKNDAATTRTMGWWWYVDQRPDGGYGVQRMDGLPAEEARARAEGTLQPRWEPEPGETDWIKCATAEHLSRFPPKSASERDIARVRREENAKYMADMARWANAKPWRQAQVA